jgi:hypothetical protein
VDELLATDPERLLAPGEVEALPQGQHEALDVIQQRRFQVALAGAIAEPHEVQDNGISRDALHRLRVTGLERVLEVRDRRTLALVQAAGDGRLELCSRPGARPCGVPVPGGAVVELLYQLDYVPPRKVSHTLCKTIVLRPGQGEGPHACEIGGREAGGSRESRTQVRREPPYHPWRAPAALQALLGLATNDLPADLPVHLDQLGVGRPRGPCLRAADTDLDVREELFVALSRGP